MFYQIPATLSAEIEELAALIEQHRRGELTAAALKARRVPFGCYEQRKDGTFMVRVRTVGGALTPSQLRRIAELSVRYGSEAIHITTRQEFQIHDVALENVATILRALLAVGLSTRGGGGNTVRNILVSPDAGVSPQEAFDPSPYAFALTSRLIAEPDSWVLPRKYKIAFSNTSADTAYAQFNDLGFIARLSNGQRGFRVYVAGGMGSKPEVGHLLHDFIPADEIYEVAEAIKKLFDQNGNRKNKYAARLRFLWRQLGEPRFRELYEAERQKLRAANVAALTPTELAANSATPSLAPRPAVSAEFATWKVRYCHVQAQPGLYSVVVPVLLGNVKNDDVLALADLLVNFGAQSVRATLGQNLRLRNIPEAYLGNVFEVVSRIAPLAAQPALLGNAIACTGADTCKLGICLPKGALQAIARKLPAAGLALDEIADFKLHLSGCPNSCGQHPLADLGFYGEVARQGQRMYPAYGVVAGAKTIDGAARLALAQEHISARALPDFVVDVLRTWIAKKANYKSFADYVDGVGAQDLRAIADRYRAVPAFEDDKNYYYDWGAEAPFSLVGKGVGECSAGLFDLIEIDLKQIYKLREQLATATSTERESLLYALTLSTARMLLVTRGVEAPSNQAVFASFLQHFIAAGLIEARYRAVVEAARDRDFPALARQASEVLALSEAVEALYASMDNSLRFPAETAPLPTLPAAQERDYRGVACPMNFVKVKLDLSKMQAGETLRVLLDDGAPIENVPRSVAGEGHKILVQEREGEHWVVVIEKSK